jgi:hypothetical protein
LPLFKTICWFLLNNTTYSSSDFTDCSSCFYSCNYNLNCTAYSWNNGELRNWGDDEYCQSLLPPSPSSNSCGKDTDILNCPIWAAEGECTAVKKLCPESCNCVCSCNC